MTAHISPPEAPAAPAVHLELPGGRLEAATSELLLGPRQTGVNHLAEFLFLMHVGTLQWEQIARHAGMRLRDLHSGGRRRVYATFYYVWERFSLHRPMAAYRIDDLLSFHSGVRLCGGTAVDGWHAVFHENGEGDAASVTAGAAAPPRPGDLAAAGGPAWVRMSNVFVQMRSGPHDLEVILPENLPQERFPQGGACLDTYQTVKEVRRRGGFPPPLGRRLRPLGGGPFHHTLEINRDRDINGVGLVYFANYITFLDAAERTFLRTLLPPPAREERIDGRSLVERQMAYYGNADGGDRVDVVLSAHEVLPRPGDPPGSTILWLDYRVSRRSDGQLICLSSAAKRLPGVAPGELPGRGAGRQSSL